MDITTLIDVLVGVVMTGAAYFIVSLQREVKRIDILLNRTREDYATKFQVRDDIDRVMEALHRVEDKLDRVLTEELVLDPVSITAAYTAVKKGIEVGKDITQLMSEIGSLWTAIEEVETGYRKEKQKKQSVEEEALDLFAAKCAAKDAEETYATLL